MPDSASVAPSATVTGVRCQAPSASSLTAGAVLSIRIVRAAVVVSLPTSSGTSARMSQDPSVGVHDAGTAAQEPVPAGADWKTTCAASTPEPASVAVTDSAIVPCPNAPGSSSVAV